MTRTERHYGLDWLRIAAFGLLIFYHIGLVFAPWDWIIHAPWRFEALIVPMELVSTWRLSLLFAVSGYASRKLFDKTGGAKGFAASRAKRLLIPLAFGMAVLVPPEMWVLVMENGYPHSLPWFWAFDYWRWGEFYGRQFPSWEHLWFLAYLAAYTFVLTAALHWGGARVFGWFDRAATWLAKGHRLLWAPGGAMVLAKLAMMFVIPERQGLFTDWTGHAHYFPVFLFGFVLAGSTQLWPALARLWRVALLGAALSAAIDLRIELTHPGNTPIGHAEMALDRSARIMIAWTMVLALLHLANRWWNHDHRWRKPLAEAVFPFYLVHHGAIVLITWYSLPLRLSAGAEFALLLGGVSAVCLATYLIGGRIGWLRPLIGLSPKPRAPAPPAAELGAAR